jgi:hypothetical protein
MLAQAHHPFHWGVSRSLGAHMSSVRT